MYHLEERIEFIHRRFSGKPVDKSSPWWSELKAGLKLRNKLTHPKDVTEITADSVNRALQSIIDTLDALYKAVFHVQYPLLRRGLDSSMTF